MRRAHPRLVQDYLLDSAEELGAREALIGPGGRHTYGEILAAANALARWLRARGFEPGARAAILSDDPFDYVAAYFAILLAGGVAVGINTQASRRQLLDIAADCDVSAVLTSTRFSKLFAALAPLRLPAAVRGELSDDDRRRLGDCADWAEIVAAGGGTDKAAAERRSTSDIAQIIYTSGTTGSPKGVGLRHSNLIANTESIVEYLALSSADRVMAVLPFFYSYGNSLLLTHVAVGGSLVVNQRFVYPNVVLESMAREEVTGFSGVPSTFAILLHRSAIRDYSFPRLRYVTQAGGPMSPATIQAVRELLPGVEVFIMYGQTEAAARLSYLEPEALECKLGSIGKGIPGVELDLLDAQGRPVGVGEVGEIVATGDNIMAGYWGRPEETRKVLRDGALWTGDLARRDEDGYLYIVGRESDMIKSGAHRIGPKEIEDAVLEHPDVQEAAVVGVEDPILGEAIRACVVLRPGKECDEKTLLAHCRRLLPAYEVPHETVFLPELPKTTTGKVRKNELKGGPREVVTAG